MHGDGFLYVWLYEFGLPCYRRIGGRDRVTSQGWEGWGAGQGLRTQAGRKRTQPGPLRLRAPQSNHAVAPSRRRAQQGSMRGFGNIARGRPLCFFVNDGNKTIYHPVAMWRKFWMYGDRVTFSSCFCVYVLRLNSYYWGKVLIIKRRNIIWQYKRFFSYIEETSELFYIRRSSMDLCSYMKKKNNVRLIN